jgi:hypothetical protein
MIQHNSIEAFKIIAQQYMMPTTEQDTEQNFINRYTKEDEDYLIKNYGKLPIQTIANKLGRKSLSYLRTKAIKLGLTREYRKFTQEEDEFILKNKEKMTFSNIARILKRQQGSVILLRYNKIKLTGKI